MNLALSAMYGNGYWLEAELAKSIASQMFFFLKAYQVLAHECLVARKRRFPIMPKCHYLMHTAVQLWRQAQKSHWSQNPLGWSVQLQEDFIGRPSRVSRRVDVRQVHRSTINRSLILAEQAFRQSDSDRRGLL